MKKKILYRGKFLNLVSRGNWEYTERGNCSGVVIILACTPDNKLLLVEQFRPPVDSLVIELPAGLVNDQKGKRETVITAAKRELLEETGYTAKKYRKLIEGPFSGGTRSDKLTMVEATGLKKISEGGGDDTEKIIVHEVPVKEINQWLNRMKRRGKMIEPKIYAGLYFLNAYNTGH